MPGGDWRTENVNRLSVLAPIEVGVTVLAYFVPQLLQATNSDAYAIPSTVIAILGSFAPYYIRECRRKWNLLDALHQAQLAYKEKVDERFALEEREGFDVINGSIEHIKNHLDRYDGTHQSSDLLRLFLSYINNDKAQIPASELIEEPIRVPKIKRPAFNIYDSTFWAYDSIERIEKLAEGADDPAERKNCCHRIEWHFAIRGLCSGLSVLLGALFTTGAAGETTERKVDDARLAVSIPLAITILANNLPLVYRFIKLGSDSLEKFKKNRLEIPSQRFDEHRVQQVLERIQEFQKQFPQNARRVNVARYEDVLLRSLRDHFRDADSRTVTQAIAEKNITKERLRTYFIESREPSLRGCIETLSSMAWSNEENNPIEIHPPHASLPRANSLNHEWRNYYEEIIPWIRECSEVTEFIRQRLPYQYEAEESAWILPKPPRRPLSRWDRFQAFFCCRRPRSEGDDHAQADNEAEPTP